MSTKIAVTYEDGQVFQHFGRTQQVKIYEIDNGKIVSTQIVDTSEHGHGAMAGYVKGFGATVIICGGLGDGARNSVRDAGLELVNGVSGDADAAVRAYIDGTLVRSGGDCDHHCHHRLHQTESSLLSSSISETSEIVSRSSTEIPEPSRVNYCFFSEELYDLNMALA